MAMHFVPLIPTLIQKGQFEESSHIGSFARERDEERDVRGIVLDALAVWVKIDGPRIPAHIKRIGRYVLPNPNPFGQRITRDLKMVGPVDGLGDRRRCGCRGRRRGRA